MKRLSLFAPLLLACSSSSTSDNGTSATSAAETPSATALAASGTATATARPASSWGPFPTNARRDSAPPGLKSAAVKLGALAPSLDLALTDGTRFDLPGALTKHSHVVLVFYRGAW